MHSDAVISAPYDAAWKPQTVIRYDQCEFIGNAEKIGKLQRCTGAGYVTNNACVLVAAIVDFGSFHNSNAWRNPSFNHHNNPDLNAADDSVVTLMAPKRAAKAAVLECGNRIDSEKALTHAIILFARARRVRIVPSRLRSMAASATTALQWLSSHVQRSQNAAKHPKMEAINQVAGKALRGAGDFLRAFNDAPLSFAGACPAFRKTSAILGD